MTEIVVAQRMWQRRDFAAAWTTANPILAAGEIGVELGATSTDPQKFKIGNGASPWVDLDYAGSGTGSTPVEFRTSGGFIQWSNDGGTTWTNLVPLSTITGPAGPTGATGPAGPTGATGPAGPPGAPAPAALFSYITATGDFYLTRDYTDLFGGL